MNRLKLEEIESSIRNASPLELADNLEKAELYDAKTTRDVVEEIYQEFSKQGNLVEEVVVPVFTAVADGLLEFTPATRKLRKKGLTSSKIVKECMAFSYDEFKNDTIIPDGYSETKNVREQTGADFINYGENVRGKYGRTTYEDKGRLNDYKNDIFEKNGGKINAMDEYTGKNNVYQSRSNPDGRRNIEKYKHDHQAEVDHIVPLKQIHEQLKGNYALTVEDIKNIANADANLALTSARINRGVGAPGAGGKFEMTNMDFVADQRKREEEGRPNLGLSEEEKNKMIQMGDAAQKSINQNANKSIGKNLTGQGAGDTMGIWTQLGGNAAKQSKDYVIGSVILYLIKPLYYEISDIFKNGLVEGVEAGSVKDALRIRFGRVKKYVLANTLTFLKDNVLEFVKGFVSSIIEGIISLFIGIFKQILKVLKEGIKILTQAGRVLFGKDSCKKSPAEKGDAIIKILGASVIAICGIGIEALLNKIGIGEPWSVILSTILSGIAATLFMLLLDKIDLFSVKAERRSKRISEIFDERIKDINNAIKNFSEVSIETMRKQKLQFVQIEKKINEGIQTNDIETINVGLFDLAKFMKTDLGYNNLETFVDKFDDDNVVISL